MNHIQFGLFGLYVISQLCAGVFIYTVLTGNKGSGMNKSVYLGESSLLGGVFIVGELLILSLAGLYKSQYLWSAAALNYLFLLHRNTRSNFCGLFIKREKFNLLTAVFIILLFLLAFRNCFFMFDTDSMSTYLFSQKMWLSSGTSMIGDATYDCRVFVPQFNAVPYGLGMSLFPKETLFPQLVNLWWRITALLLIFGYTSYRFNKCYGLAAAFFVAFNEHFFYSGANRWVMLNAAVIAFFFASAYSFWEARTQNSRFRLLLALIFASQLIPNKYQMAYDSLLLVLLGIFIQIKPLNKLKEIFGDKKSLLFLLIALAISSLWFIKNMILTGNPLFPLLAGKLGTFGWSPELEKVMLKASVYLPFGKFFKFMSFFFIWPGVNVAKYVIIFILFLPFIIGISIMKPKFDKAAGFELCFWLGLSLISVIGVCYTGWQDPRAYRYPLGILAFTVIFTLHYLFTACLSINKRALLCGLILAVSLIGSRNEGPRIITQKGGPFGFPTYKENIDTFRDRIHTDYAVKKYYPQIETMLETLGKNQDKLASAAWNLDSFNFNFPAFLLPQRPITSLWDNAMIKWDSYKDENLIINDFNKYGIKWIIIAKGNDLVFMEMKDYAREAVNYKRYPDKVFQDYGFPAELTKITY